MPSVCRAAEVGQFRECADHVSDATDEGMAADLSPYPSRFGLVSLNSAGRYGSGFALSQPFKLSSKWTCTDGARSRRP